MYTFLVVPLYSFYMLIYIFFLHIYKFNQAYISWYAYRPVSAGMLRIVVIK